MGHRHLSGKSQIFNMEPDQNRNHIPAEQPFVHLGMAGPPENGSVVFPVESISTTGVTAASQWNLALRSNDYPSSSLSMEVPHYRPASGGASFDPFLQPSAVGSYRPGSQTYTHQASSSGYYRDTIHGTEGSFVSPTVDGGRGSRKRKGIAVPICERGSTSRYYDSGSSSDASICSNAQQEKPSFHSQHWGWDPVSINTSYRGGSLSIGNEGSQRNVRRRPTLDLEANLARTNSGSVSRLPHSSGYSVDHSAMMDPARLGVNATTQGWSHNSIPPVVARGRIPAIGTTGLNQDTNHFLGVCSRNGSTEIGGYQNDSILSRNPVIPPQNLHGNATQAVRSGRSSHYQRSSMPAYRASLSYPRLGHITSSSEDVLQLASETYSSRHLRQSSTAGWRSNDRSGRSRLPYERFRSLSDDAGVHDRLVSEGLMIVDRSALYGSRNLFDQHREMRLDVDNMTYEELLALGERIGSVNTGLAGDKISKCMRETIYCSSDQIQEEGTCVICLEEYKDREEVGTLNNCRHDYHVGCIKKWLSVKNVCPICKTPALSDDSKDN